MPKHPAIRMRVLVDVDERIAPLVAHLDRLGCVVYGSSPGNIGDDHHRQWAPYVQVYFPDTATRDAVAREYDVDADDEPDDYGLYGVVNPRGYDESLRGEIMSYERFDAPRVTMSLLACIDEGIAERVAYLNTIPGVRTLSSCQGDPEPGHRPHVMVDIQADEARQRLLREFAVTLMDTCPNYAVLHDKGGDPYEADIYAWWRDLAPEPEPDAC